MQGPKKMQSKSAGTKKQQGRHAEQKVKGKRAKIQRQQHAEKTTEQKIQRRSKGTTQKF